MRTELRATALALTALLVAACSGSVAAPDVLFVSIDTLRADALSCYGNPRATSPSLDALAQDALVFENAWACAPTTGPSHASLFTGLAPGVHRVATVIQPDRGDPRLQPEYVTLAERFAAAGYRTVAVTDGGPMGLALSLLQGFDEVFERSEGVVAKVDRALSVLADPDPRPLFLFLHTYQTHLPYTAPPRWSDRFVDEYDGPLVAWEHAIRAKAELDPALLIGGFGLPPDLEPEDHRHLRARYDGEVAFVDAELERLWDHLRGTGRLDELLLIVTSDHGEEFGEHGGVGHGQVWNEHLRVPLILRWPSVLSPQRRPERVSQIDLAPTLLALCNLPGAAQAPPLLRTDLDRSIFAEDAAHLFLDKGPPWRRSVRRADHSLISEDDGREERVRIFDLRTDPRERAPVARARSRSGGPALDLGGEFYSDLYRELAAQRDADARLAFELVPDRAERVMPAPSARQRSEMIRLGYLDAED